MFNSNTYILREDGSNDVWLVDCGDTHRVLEQLSQNEKIVGVLFTHGHSDHIYGVNELICAFPHVKIFSNEYGILELGNARLNCSYYHDDVDDIVINPNADLVSLESDVNGVEFNEGWLHAVAYHTPGHDDSCMTYVIDDYVFTGDSHIPGVKVVTIFRTGNRLKANESEQKILELANGRHLMPGHTLSPDIP